jgi:membrane fusion protein (multidrug efflux system)
VSRSRRPSSSDPRPVPIIYTYLVLAALLLLAGCGGSAESAAGADGVDSEDEEDAIAVSAGTVMRQPISSLYTTSATLRADKRATVTARTHGVVRELLVEEGDRVRKDQRLAQLEDEEQRIAFERAVAARDTTRLDLARTVSLHEQGLVSDEEFETTRREADEAKHTAALQELTLSRTTIRAPFEGQVLHRHIDPGATVSDGVPVYDLADLDPLYADVNVPERHIARLAIGQAVRLVADSASEQAEAIIERIAPSVDPTTGTVKVTLAVRGTTGLRPGSFARVDIVTDTHDEALVVPRSALVAEGRRWYVFRVTEQGEKVDRLEVNRGFEEGDSVEILEILDADKTLSDADRVVVRGASALTDDARIELIEPKESSDETSADEATDGENDRVAT